MSLSWNQSLPVAFHYWRGRYHRLLPWPLPMTCNCHYYHQQRWNHHGHLGLICYTTRPVSKLNKINQKLIWLFCWTSKHCFTWWDNLNSVYKTIYNKISVFRWFEHFIINFIQHNIVVSIGQKSIGKVYIVNDFEHDWLSAFDIIDGRKNPIWNSVL